MKRNEAAPVAPAQSGAWFQAKRVSRSLTYIGVLAPCLAVACAASGPEDDTGGSGSGGRSNAGRGGSTGGVHAGAGGTQGGSTSTAGKAGAGTSGTTGGTGVAGSVSGGSGRGGGSGGIGGAGVGGSASGTGGAAGSVGESGTGGGAGTFGKGGAGGKAGGGAGGRFGAGGAAGSGDGGGSGGTSSGGAGSGSGGGSSGTGSSGTGSGGPVDCDTPMPTGGTEHCGQNTQGKAGGLSWSLWSNTLNSNACITTFEAPAFSARFNNNGDFLARVGLEFGNSGKPYDQHGIIKADFSYKKTGSAGGYSYIGVYGWTTDPCVEWYIVDDRWGSMPFNAYNATLKGTANMDGADYKLFQNRTNGTGGSRCNGVSQWDQFWSIRQSARQCGTITVTEHFKAWEAAGLQLGGMLEVKILVESGGDAGSIEFPVANVTESQ